MYEISIEHAINSKIKVYLCRKKMAMQVNPTTFQEVHHPYYILEESKLRRNLELISGVAKAAGVDIILAFKAFALWKTFPIFREYIGATTASSLYEARLGYELFGSPTHTYSPAYTLEEMPEIARCSSHLTFNSLSQYERLSDVARQANPKVSFGLRVNPEYSEVATLLYNPCAPGTRFGVTEDQLPERLPDGIEGFHCHTLCESGADVFERTLSHIEAHFSRWFDQIQWINFGGGHLMTRKDYDVDRLVAILKDFRRRYPHLKVILEPGSAFAWQTGPLVSQVVDVVENHGIRTAILNVSFTCHMPDCLEMPYHPDVRFAETLTEEEAQQQMAQGQSPIYRLGGCSCLSGDFMGYWRFDHELRVGENIIFEDMIHYTTVKTNMFNGISHPSLALLHPDGEMEVLRRYSFEDYRDRMD
jgi:carboxynorspermidine decarboxylase